MLIKECDNFEEKKRKSSVFEQKRHYENEIEVLKRDLMVIKMEEQRIKSRLQSSHFISDGKEWINQFKKMPMRVDRVDLENGINKLPSQGINQIQLNEDSSSQGSEMNFDQ